MRQNQTRQPDPDKRKNAPGVGKNKYDKPASFADENRKPEEVDSNPQDQPSGEFRRSVTNTDEQDKITNTESESPLDEKEKEGV
jgi:hypothetical protein